MFIRKIGHRPVGWEVCYELIVWGCVFLEILLYFQRECLKLRGASYTLRFEESNPQCAGELGPIPCPVDVPLIEGQVHGFFAAVEYCAVIATLCASENRWYETMVSKSLTDWANFQKRDAVLAQLFHCSDS
jgi:hypothetical protein